MIFNNTSTSREQNFSIPMTPIVDNNNFSNFLDSNDFLFSENHIKESNFQEEIPQNKANNDPNNNSSLLLYCNQVAFFISIIKNTLFKDPCKLWVFPNRRA